MRVGSPLGPRENPPHLSSALQLPGNLYGSPWLNTMEPFAPASSLTSHVPILTKFPARGLPDPRTSINLRTFPVRYPDDRLPWQICFDRWFCCKCAEYDGDTSTPGLPPLENKLGAAAERDRVPPPLLPSKCDAGIINTDKTDSPYNGCATDGCGHRKCRNCGLGTFTSVYKHSVFRTVGGLHVSPRFIDPVHWECLCGEWQHNHFDKHCVFADDSRPPVVGAGLYAGSLMHVRSTLCANPACTVSGWGSPGFLGLGPGPGPGALSARGSLTRSSVVMNAYGQRLGTADQSVMVTDGPWHRQRQALGDAKCALVRNLRPKPFRNLGPDTVTTGGDSARLWKQGDAAPAYPDRPDAPDPSQEFNDVEKHFEYEKRYLDGLPLEPVSKGKDVDHFGSDGYDSAVEMMETEHDEVESGTEPDVCDLHMEDEEVL